MEETAATAENVPDPTTLTATEASNVESDEKKEEEEALSPRNVTEPMVKPTVEEEGKKRIRSVRLGLRQLKITLNDDSHENLLQPTTIDDSILSSMDLTSSKRKTEPRAKDDLYVFRRPSIRDVELEREKAVEKKALRAFVRRRKNWKGNKKLFGPEISGVGAQKDEHVENNILFFSEASFLSPTFLCPITLCNKTWLTCLHYYLVHLTPPQLSIFPIIISLSVCPFSAFLSASTLPGP